MISNLLNRFVTNCLSVHNDLQLAAGHDFVAFRQLARFGLFAKAPGKLSCPLFRHGREVVQHDAQAQITVDLGVVIIGRLYQGNKAVMDHEAVSLAV